MHILHIYHQYIGKDCFELIISHYFNKQIPPMNISDSFRRYKLNRVLCFDRKGTGTVITLNFRHISLKHPLKGEYCIFAGVDEFNEFLRDLN